MPARIRSSQFREPRINIDDRSELERWAGELRVSEKQLMSAIKKAGAGVEAVKNELRRKTSLGPAA